MSVSVGGVAYTLIYHYNFYYHYNGVRRDRRFIGILISFYLLLNCFFFFRNLALKDEVKKRRNLFTV